MVALFTKREVRFMNACMLSACHFALTKKHPKSCKFLEFQGIAMDCLQGSGLAGFTPGLLPFEVRVLPPDRLWSVKRPHFAYSQSSASKRVKRFFRADDHETVPRLERTNIAS